MHLKQNWGIALRTEIFHSFFGRVSGHRVVCVSLGVESQRKLLTKASDSAKQFYFCITIINFYHRSPAA